MKKLTVLILSLIISLTAAGCSESTPGTDIPIATQKAGGTPDPDSSIVDTLNPPIDKLTPATTVIEDFRKSSCEIYDYIAKSQKTETIKDDTGATVTYYYEGSVKDSSVKKQLFETVSSILSQDEIHLQGTQDVQGGGTPILTMKTVNNMEFRLSEGILVASPELEGGDMIYIFTGPDNDYHYLPQNTEDDRKLEKLIAQGIQIKENLVRTEKSGGDTKPETKKLSPEEIAYMCIRSNFAWGRHISGSYITVDGELYNFDFSKLTSADRIDGSFEQWVLNQICEQSPYAGKGITVNTEKIKSALEYAEKINPDAKVTKKYEMCDYGQDTAYAVVDCKPVMLSSYGDVMRTVEDDNAKKADKLFKEAFPPVDICE